MYVKCDQNMLQQFDLRIKTPISIQQEIRQARKYDKFSPWLLEVKLTGALSFAEEGDLVPSDEEVEETEGDLEMGLVKVGAWVGPGGSSLG